MPPPAQIPAVAPDGTPGYIDSASLQAAVNAGYKPGMTMRASDGTKGVVAFTDMAEARANGYKTEGEYSQPITTPPSVLSQFLHHPIASIDKLTTVTPDQRAGNSPLVNAAQNFGAGALGATLGVVAHPYDTIKNGIMGAAYTSPLGALLDPAGNPLINQAKAIAKDPTNTLPALAGGLAGGTVAGEAVSALPAKIGSVMSGDPNAAALRGLQVGAKSPEALGVLRAVDNARPFLQGVKDQADLQARISPVKAEIWKPYQDAVDAIGDRPVNGPSGPTTVRELEAERLQLSALNRGLRSGDPAAVQLAQQKGMSQAQLLDHETDVKAALDPELASTGINPKLIRDVFGSVSKIGNRVAGKTTLIEPEKPTGLGKIANLDIKKPFKAPGDVLSGIRDILAGRPLLGAKPTDLGIREGFAPGGVKPDFGRVQTTGVPPPAPTPNIAGLLNAPPIELGGRVLPTQPPNFYYDTTPMRLGRLLPSPIEDVPLSSDVKQFPNQRPGSARVRNPKLIDLIRESGQ